MHSLDLEDRFTRIGMILQKYKTYRIENGKKVYYQFECIHCGDCCRFLDILLEKEDILKWISEKRGDLLAYIQIQPESLSADFFVKAELEGKLDEMKQFLLTKHHRSQSEDFQRDSLMFSHLFLPDIGRNSILSPDSYETVLAGMKVGIKYMFVSRSGGDCVFFTGNGCSIYESKPLICTRFPFETNGTLAVNDWTLRLCKGIKRIEKIK
jgi:Fe-S-cluster containining protein